jgi:HD-GYP domain-containing protein (c-di-GMP phosphodiesterase class II)
MEMMKQHSSIGAEMLRPITSLQCERQFVLHHHEWWNGAGYPNRLAGTSIPFGARLLQIADCIDAMISPRSYKPPRDAQYVIAQLNQGRERQFDPQIADAAINWLRQDSSALTLSV